MTIKPLGRITVPTPGTPVPVYTTDITQHAHLVSFVQRASGTGYVHILYKGIRLRSLAPAPPNGMLDVFEVEAENERVLVSDFTVDAAVANEGPDVYFGVL